MRSMYSILVSGVASAKKVIHARFLGDLLSGERIVPVIITVFDAHRAQALEAALSCRA